MPIPATPYSFQALTDLLSGAEGELGNVTNRAEELRGMVAALTAILAELEVTPQQS